MKSYASVTMQSNETSSAVLSRQWYQLFSMQCKLLSLWTLGSFSNDDGDGDGNQDVKKAIGLLRKITTLHVHHAFLYISSPSLHDYDVKMPNCKFYGGRKSDDESLFLSLNLSAVLKKSTPGKFAYTCHFQQTGINATKIEKTGIHFKSDVFAAVAVVDAKAP